MANFKQSCGDCEGTGSSREVIGRFLGIFKVYAPCKRCNGTGDNYPPIETREERMNRPASPPPPPIKR